MAKRNRWEGASKFCKYGIKMLGEVSDVSLPDGWIGVYHVSGGIIYLHRETRVVTWAMPYTIPKDKSVRKHNVPLTAVPCLLQKRSLNDGEAVNGDDGRPCKEPGSEVAPEEQGPHAKVMRLEDGETNDESVVNQNGKKTATDDIEISIGKDTDKTTESSDDITVTNVNGLFKGDCNVQSLESCPYSSDGRKKKKLSRSKNVIEEPCQLVPSKPTEEDPCNHNGLFSRAATLSFLDSDDVSVENETSFQTNGSAHNHESSETNSEEPSMPVSCTNSAEFRSPDEERDDYYRDFSHVVNPYEVTPASLHNYLSTIYEFTELTAEQLAEPVFICADYQDENEETKKLSTVGKTPFQILNEYCQRQLKSLPVMKEVERHSQHDFTVEILIKNMKFGIANGDTMRGAKHGVAKITLNIIDTSVLKDDEPSGYLAVFDKIPIGDKSVLPTIEEFLPLDLKYPYETLLIFLARNYPDFMEGDIEYETVECVSDEKPTQEFKMRYKDFSVAGTSENPKLTKEVAAQAMVGVVYPQLRWWGSVIRLTENYLEVSQEREARKGIKPNKCIMHVLRKEMQKIARNHSLES